MRCKALLTLVLTNVSVVVFAQAQTPQPTPAARAPRPPATPTVTVQVADSSGLPLQNVQVAASGPLSREGTTAEDGAVRFANMRAGNYRLRLVHEGSITLEHDITVRASEPLLVDITLNAAPVVKAPEAPRAAPPPPTNTAKPLGPPAEPKITPIPSFLEKNFIGAREPQKSSMLGCTST